MTLEQFKMHRNNLVSGLEGLLDEGDVVRSVIPVYKDSEVFVANVDRSDGSTVSAVCVGRKHPKFSEADEFPGCAGTWWWEDDLNA